MFLSLLVFGAGERGERVALFNRGHITKYDSETRIIPGAQN